MVRPRSVGGASGRGHHHSSTLNLSVAGLELLVSFAADVPASVRDAVRAAFPARAAVSAEADGAAGQRVDDVAREPFARIEVRSGHRRRVAGAPIVLADGDELRHLPGGGFQLWSREAVAEWGNGTAVMSVTCDDEPYMVSALITTILLEMAHQKGWSGYHGALIAGADRAVLVVGASGQGKSTTAGAGLAAGLTVAADDAVLVRPGLSGAPLVEAAGVSDLLMIPAGSGEPAGTGAPAGSGEPAGRLDARGRRRLRRRPGADGWFGLEVVLVVTHGRETQTVLEPVDRLTVTRALVAANLGDFNRPGRAEGAMRLLERLTALDRYRLALGADPGERGSSTARLLSELVAGRAHGARSDG